MAKTDTMILHEGMNALKDKLGIIDSEKFISILLKKKFGKINPLRKYMKKPQNSFLRIIKQANLV